MKFFLKISIASLGIFLFSGLSILYRRATFPETYFPLSFPPGSSYTKNSWSSIQVGADSDSYSVDAIFRDEFGELQRWKYSVPISEVEESLQSFGLPSDILEPYYATEEEILRRQSLFQRGAFKLVHNVLVPDYTEMMRRYGKSGRYLAKQVYLKARERGNTSSTALALLLLSAIQDIPYGIPPNIMGDKFIGGVFPQPITMVIGYGDCDSKSLLFASAGIHLGFKLILIGVPGHMLFGIQGVPGPYQQYAKYNGNSYILGESSGPAKFPLGKTNEYYGDLVVIPIN